MKIAKSFFYLLCLSFMLNSCFGGYEQSSSTISRNYLVQIPYIQGDSSGLLTGHLIKEFSSSFPNQLANQSNISLQVKMLNEVEDNIGFQYEIDDNGNRENKIIPNENRLTLTAEVKLVELSTGEVLIGPEIVKVSGDFDFDFDAMKNDDMSLSLGQLNGLNDARDSAKFEIGSYLAKKIVQMLQDMY
jgi:hypothetical protein